MIEDIQKLRAKGWGVKSIAQRLKLPRALVSYLVNPKACGLATWACIFRDSHMTVERSAELLGMHVNQIRKILARTPPKPAKPLSGFIGVLWNNDRWEASVLIDRQRVVVGYSPDPISCAWIRENAIHDGQLENQLNLNHPPERRKEPR